MNKEQLKAGLQYAEENFLNENANHLIVDKKLIREKFDLTGKRILDFGCGMGGMTLWYANNWHCNVLGLDIDEHHIMIAKKIRKKHNVNNVRFEVKDILTNPLTEQFDYIFLNDVAEHIPLNILQQILQHLNESLTENGQIFITYPPWKSPYASHVAHAVGIPWCQYLPEKQLIKIIKKNNMKIIGDKESDLLEAYKGLNHLTHKKLMKVINVVGMKPVLRKSHCILNKLPGLKNIPFRIPPLDFLITKEFLLLEKNTKVNSNLITELGLEIRPFIAHIL